MINKKLGNDFEREFAEKLSEIGYWVHLLNQNSSGQPADLIAVKNGNGFLIDCKVCTNSYFLLSRIEENQKLAARHWKECNNGDFYFAIKMNEEIYLTTLTDLPKSQKRIDEEWLKINGRVIQ